MKRYMKFFVGLNILALLLAGCGEKNDPTSEAIHEDSSYTVTWKNWNGDVLETDRNVQEGTMPSYDGMTPTRPNDDDYAYTWSGWDPQVVPAYSNQIYTATYSSEKLKTEYIINFDLNGGTSASYTGSKTVEAFTKDIFFFDCVKDGWNFRGWSYDGTKIFDEKGNQLANPTMAKNMTFMAMYAQTAKLTIYSNIEGAGHITGAGEYPYNTQVDVYAHPNNGYDFIGWYYQDTLLSNTESYKYMMWSEDIALEARFQPKTYTLNIHTNNEDYGLVLLKNYSNNYRPVYEQSCYYSTQITISAYSKTDVRFLGWYSTDNKLVETNAVYSFIMPNHDYTLEAKWNYFTVTYNLNEGTNNPSNPTSYAIDSTTGLTLKDPTRTGYDFLGWQYKGIFVTAINPEWIDNITLNAVWKAHDYSISYVLNSGTNHPSNPTNYTIEDDTITLFDASRDGYTFAGWYETPTSYERITQILNGSYGDITLYARWALIQYSITYYLDGGTNSSENPSLYTKEDTIILQNPSKKGYTFVGWFDEDGNQIVTIPEGTTGAISLTAHWDPNLNGLLVTSEDETKGTVAIVSGSGYSGELITVSATPIGNCIFDGWYHGDFRASDETTYTFTMPTEDYSLIARFLTPEEEQDHEFGIIPTISDDGKTVTYGLYPQKRVKDTSLISSLNGLTPESNGWYLYENMYYTKTSANPYSSSYTFNDGTKIVKGTTYWFECSPIVWNILDNNNGDYYLLSSTLLEPRRYAQSSNNYANSEIRAWLNGTFYNTAFALGNSYIQTTAVNNSASSTESASNPYISDTTNDKVFLPSYQDFLNFSYGFSESPTSSSTRCCQTTDWSRAKGIWYVTSEQDILYNDGYWTRTPSSVDSTYAYYINTYGSVVGNNSNCSVDRSIVGVRPAITLRLSLH